MVLVILLLLLMHARRSFSLAPNDFDEENKLSSLCETTLLSIRKAHSAAKSPKPTGRIMHVEAIILHPHKTYADTPHDLISLRKHACIISRAETMPAQVTISTPTLKQYHHHDYDHGHHTCHVVAHNFGFRAAASTILEQQHHQQQHHHRSCVLGMLDLRSALQNPFGISQVKS